MLIKIDKERLNAVIEKMCDDYCKLPDICPTQERLNRHCAECPLNNLQCEDEYPFGRNDWQE